MTTVVVLGTYAWSLRQLTTNSGKVIRELQISVKKVTNGLARRCELEGHGFKSQCQQRLFCNKIFVELKLFFNLYVLILVRVV